MAVVVVMLIRRLTLTQEIDIIGIRGPPFIVIALLPCHRS